MELNSEQISIVCISIDARLMMAEFNVSKATELGYPQVSEYWQHEAEKCRVILAYFRSHA